MLCNIKYKIEFYIVIKIFNQYFMYVTQIQLSALQSALRILYSIFVYKIYRFVCALNNTLHYKFYLDYGILDLLTNIKSYKTLKHRLVILFLLLLTTWWSVQSIVIAHIAVLKPQFGGKGVGQIYITDNYHILTSQGYNFSEGSVWANVDLTEQITIPYLGLYNTPSHNVGNIKFVTYLNLAESKPLDNLKGNYHITNNITGGYNVLAYNNASKSIDIDAFDTLRRLASFEVDLGIINGSTLYASGDFNASQGSLPSSCINLCNKQTELKFESMIVQNNTQMFISGLNTYIQLQEDSHYSCNDILSVLSDSQMSVDVCTKINVTQNVFSDSKSESKIYSIVKYENSIRYIESILETYTLGYRSWFYLRSIQKYAMLNIETGVNKDIISTEVVILYDNTATGPEAGVPRINLNKITDVVVPSIDSLATRIALTTGDQSLLNTIDRAKILAYLNTIAIIITFIIPVVVYIIIIIIEGKLSSKYKMIHMPTWIQILRSSTDNGLFLPTDILDTNAKYITLGNSNHLYIQCHYGVIRSDKNISTDQELLLIKEKDSE